MFWIELISDLWHLPPSVCPLLRTACAGSGNACTYDVTSPSIELPGLTARLDRLVYHHGVMSLPLDKPHAFVYFVTLLNGSDRVVTLLGRKWVIEHEDGTRVVLEGDKIVGETPRLAPGERFSYNSYHVTATDARVQGSFHGADEFGGRIHVILPTFHLVVPPDPPAP